MNDPDVANFIAEATKPAPRRPAGPPLSVFAAVLAVVGHHQGPGALLSPEQLNGLVGALSAFDWSGYVSPETRFPAEDDEDDDHG